MYLSKDFTVAMECKEMWNSLNELYLIIIIILYSYKEDLGTGNDDCIMIKNLKWFFTEFKCHFCIIKTYCDSNNKANQVGTNYDY